MTTPTPLTPSEIDLFRNIDFGIAQNAVNSLLATIDARGWMPEKCADAVMEVVAVAREIGTAAMATESQWAEIRLEHVLPGEPLISIRLSFVERLYKAVTALTPPPPPPKVSAT